MSVAVALDQLEAKLAEYDWAYVVTVREDRRSHLVAVTPMWREGCLVAAVGRTTEENVAGQPSITLCFPPRDIEGFSLVVDGEAASADGVLTVRPVSAVLHRPAPPAIDDHRGRKESVS